MKKLMKKILTDKKVRNASVLTMVLLTAATTMAPWQT